MSSHRCSAHLRLALALPFLAASLGYSAETAAGQTAQRVSLQVSGLSNSLFGETLGALHVGYGVEAQLRFNPGAFSVGGGFQYTSHGVEGDADETVSLSGGFVEPRLILGEVGNSAAVYISSRLSVSTIDSSESTSKATGFTVNGGGGLLVRLGSRVNLDLGATYGFKDLGELGPRDLGQGNNLILRVGLAVGLGG